MGLRTLKIIIISCIVFSVISGFFAIQQMMQAKQKKANAAYLEEPLSVTAATYAEYQSVTGAEILGEVESGKPVAIERPSLVPAAIEIPVINLKKSVVEKVGMLDNGEMGVPEDYLKAGWFEPGYKPGENGNAVISAHVDNRKGPGVFFYLKKLIPGDQVIVFDQEGKKMTFEVKRLEVYLPEDAPIEHIFGKSDTPKLNLITCTGTFDPKVRSYDKRLVVFTELIGGTGE